MSFELSKKTAKMMAVGGLILALLLVYSIIFKPLITKIRNAQRECDTCETHVTNARDFIESVNITWTESSVLTEEDVSFAIDELTKHGKKKNINYVSITPKETEQKKDMPYPILPIEMEIESDYRSIGEFLGSLDDLKDSLITVRSFVIKPYVKKQSNEEVDHDMLTTNLVINMYLLGQKYAE
ncbi:MAG: type 4a pilus biogenesis protein PilO [Candidatus Omnitrophica bacterium]|nr:type 4a pilus biogenesis protein PilO [Candidatus Omnitrophota bacterium]